MDLEVQRHEQEHERLLADLEKLEKLTEVAVQVRVSLSSPFALLDNLMMYGCCSLYV